MKFSIITPTFNSQKTIIDTLRSVKNQKNVDFEHIVIDGSSSDQTIQIIKNFDEKIKIISEKDYGVFDAMNKGILTSTGEIIAILNSDDFFISNDVLLKIQDEFIKTDTDIAYGSIKYINKINSSKIIRVWNPGKLQKWKLWFGWSIPHPAVFIKKNVYEKIGKFDLNFKIASDYDFILRIFKDESLKIQYINLSCVAMRTGGISDQGIIARIKMMHETCLVFKKNFKIYPTWFFVTRPLIKLHQFLIISKIS